MRRRLNLIPFNVTIPVDERDKNLAEKLRAEWPGILRWMIEGCLKWQAEGLITPQTIVEATDAYLESEDSFATWVAERCELKANFEDTSANLFASWKSLAELMGEPAITRNAFGNKIGGRPGIESRRIGHAKLAGYRGIRVVKAAEPVQSNWMED